MYLLTSRCSFQYTDNAENYYNTLFNYCNYHLNFDELAAEDCTQSTYEAYYKYIHIHNIADTKAWLFRTADNFIKRYKRNCATEKRKQISFDEFNGSYIEYKLFSYTPDLDAFIERDINISDYIRIVSSHLKDNEKVFYIQYFRKQTAATDLAKAYNVSVEAIWLRAHRLKKRILKLVSKCFESE